LPVAASAADVESIFNLNETGAAVWERIDGTKKISEIIDDIKSEYEGKDNEIEEDVMRFVTEIAEAKLIEE
jgi:coenzyme PQQ biosynthesis protein PqqD